MSGLNSLGLQIVLRFFDSTRDLVVFVDQNDLIRVVLNFFFVELSEAANHNDVVDLNEPHSGTIVSCEPMTVCGITLLSSIHPARQGNAFGCNEELSKSSRVLPVAGFKTAIQKQLGLSQTGKIRIRESGTDSPTGF